MTSFTKGFVVTASIMCLIYIFFGLWKFAAAFGFMAIMMTLMGIEEQV
jgi:hypothetical protein